MADFRALCQELMDAIDSGIPVERIKQSPLAVRVDAALAQPEPEGLSDQELYDYWIGTSPEFGCADPVGFARAVLARYGRPAIEPVPVSERLPYEADCDAEGRCWFFHTSTIGGNEWFLNPLPKVSEWYRWQSITHWLPHWALPVPVVEGADA